MNFDFFRNRLILAPMVRIGSLPMRLLALEYGADLVYTEELVDWKLLKTERYENRILGTIDYIDTSDGSVIFRTCEIERERLVVQIGTSDPERALQTALKIEKDISAIDVNMGCPKSFSITGGMGAALMSNIDNAKAILNRLVCNLSIPVSCKTRIFSDRQKTLDFIRELESTGISAVAIHGRTISERPQHANHFDIVNYVSENVNIPVILNGCSKEIKNYTDLKQFQNLIKSKSVMVARAAEWNCSIFRPEGILDIETVINSYLKKAIDYDNLASNTKYCIQNILRELQDTPKGRLFLDSQTLEQIASVWELKDYYKKIQRERYHKRQNGDYLCTKKKKSRIEYENLIEMNCTYIRSNFKDNKNLPKSQLHLLAKKLITASRPVYIIEQNEKLFRSIVHFNGCRYSSTIWEKNKKFAEQAAALVCLCSLGVIDKNELIENGSLL